MAVKGSAAEEASLVALQQKFQPAQLNATAVQVSRGVSAAQSNSSVLPLGAVVAPLVLAQFLAEEGITVDEIKAVVTRSARSILDLKELPPGVINVVATPGEMVRHIEDTCGSHMEAKGLGDSASSSRSGAIFWNCATPAEPSEFGRVLVKGGLRSDLGSPEWQAFQAMAASKQLEERYSGATLLNKMLMGFDAFNLHWVVLEDVKADRLLSRLPEGLITSGPSWEAFDIKPAGSRAPQLPPCFQRLHDVAQEMGPIKDFLGWESLQNTLRQDLAFLEARHAIDESLFVQVAGPFSVEAGVYAAEGVAERVGATLQGAVPMCAHRVDEERGLMAIVCVTILDYVLTMNAFKGLQNSLQAYRWTDYEEKVTAMMSCLGDASAEACEFYREMMIGDWQNVVKRQFEAMEKRRQYNLQALEKNYRCCCYIAETEGRFTMDTRCAWLPYGEITFCPKGSRHISANTGGCVDVEPPVDEEKLPALDYNLAHEGMMWSSPMDGMEGWSYLMEMA